MISLLKDTYRSQADKSGNCFSGTVVDTEIVHSKNMDFYLLSHPGLQGSMWQLPWMVLIFVLTICLASRPAHYVVLENTPNVSADV